MLLFALVCVRLLQKKTPGELRGKRREAFERAIFRKCFERS
jgi:hypothetical protein